MGVEIKEFSVVYDALDEVEAMMAALIRPPPSKQLGRLVGTLDVQQIFKIGAIGKVAGCRVLDGYIKVPPALSEPPALLDRRPAPAHPDVFLPVGCVPLVTSFAAVISSE